ncbi:hypothetical protein ACFL5V_06050 [Fibrobacterota bacterium]
MDIYEPYFSLFTDLRKRYTVKEIKDNEVDLYVLMFKNAFVPGYFSAEAAAYPVLVLNSRLKESNPEIYDNFYLPGKDLNLVEMVSAEFSDPVAFSAFLGEIMNFRKQKHGKPPESGFGMMGYVLTFGPWSSFDNEILEDRWLEMKWKIKGQKIFEGKERTWNLVLGYTLHESDLFFDTFVIEVSRSLKSRARRITFLENSEIAFQAAVSPELALSDFISRQQFGLSMGIFYPAGKKLFFKINAGMHRELIFRDQSQRSNYLFFLVPKITF